MDGHCTLSKRLVYFVDVLGAMLRHSTLRVFAPGGLTADVTPMCGLSSLSAYRTLHRCFLLTAVLRCRFLDVYGRSRPCRHGFSSSNLRPRPRPPHFRDVLEGLNC